jgi:hypothetical protein
LLNLIFEIMSNQKNKDVVLLVEDAKQHGKTIIVPIAGAVEIDAEGKFTIDDVTASLLLNSGNGFKLVEGNGTTVTDSGNTDGDSDEGDQGNEDSDEDDSDGDTEGNESDEESDEDSDEEGDGLDELSLEELIEIASKSFEEKKYKKFMKSEKMMIQFLRKNS